MAIKIHSAIKTGAAGLLKEPFFLITLAATIIVSFFSLPKASAIHWNVLAILFSQMLVCIAFEECQLLNNLAGAALSRFSTPKKLGVAMVTLTGLMAMLVTNDIALLTVVPLTLKMAKMTRKNPYILIILETVAANIFSAFTPFGNPQNLYIFTYFNISIKEFFGTMLPFLLFGTFIMLLFTLVLSRGKTYDFEKQKIELKNKKLLIGASTAFVLNILAVLRLVDYRISLAVTVIIFLVFAPKLFLKADYILLLTFVLFFLFTDALTAIPEVKALLASVLKSESGVLLISAGVSQVISNVPAAVLLSVFTPHYRQLLYGVSAGGLGTLIASLASLISYKLYIKEYTAKKYLAVFLIINFAFLVILVGFLYFIG